MGFFETVVIVVLIATIGGVVLVSTLGKMFSSRYKAKHGIIESRDENGNIQQRLALDIENSQMREEMKLLKDRIEVLERITTDNNSANNLNRQIEELRQS